MFGNLVLEFNVKLDETIHGYRDAGTFDDHDLDPSIAVAGRAVQRNIPRRVRKQDSVIPDNISQLLASLAQQAS